MNELLKNTFLDFSPDNQRSPKRSSTLRHVDIVKLLDRAVRARTTDKNGHFNSILRLSDCTESYLFPFLLWILWLIIGTLYYANSDFQGNYSKGFYFSVNVGYSIGWGVLKENNQGSYFFSTIYLLLGATAISGCLAFLIESSMENMQMNPLHCKSIVEPKLSWNSIPEYAAYHFRNRTTFLLIVWFIYILYGTVWSCCIIGWTPIEGLYFSTSSLSTGGLHGIPEDSPDWVFGFVGLYACTGIPVMGMAMGSVAAGIVDRNQRAKLRKAISEKSHLIESEMMKALALNENNDQSLSKHEFLVLTLVRIGKVDIGLLSEIYDRFDTLDSNRDGLVAYRDIFEYHHQEERDQSFAQRRNYETVESVENVLHQRPPNPSTVTGDNQHYPINILSTPRNHDTSETCLKDDSLGGTSESVPPSENDETVVNPLQLHPLRTLPRDNSNLECKLSMEFSNNLDQ